MVGLSVPEAHGGLGLGLVDLVPLLEEAGRVALPEPLLETTALAAPLLVELAGGTGRRRPRPRWLRGSTASPGRGRRRGADRSRTGASPTPSPGPTAPICWCCTPTAPATDRQSGPRSTLSMPDAVTVRAVSSLDPTRRLGVPHWTPDAGHPGRHRDPRPRPPSADLADRAAVATAAELLGLTDRMITMAAEYAKERRQFGPPIGSFQAVKHLLAGAQVALEFARPAVYAAAWSLDEGDARRFPVRLDGQGPGLGGGHRGRPGLPAGPRGHRLHLGVRPPPVPQAGLGAGRGVGIGRRPPDGGCSTPSAGGLSRSPVDPEAAPTLGSEPTATLTGETGVSTGRRRRRATRCRRPTGTGGRDR